MSRIRPAASGQRIQCLVVVPTQSSSAPKESRRSSICSASSCPPATSRSASQAQVEQRFAAMIGVRHAIGVNSGTDALKFSLEAAGVGPGDEVITTANTFVATVGAIAENYARPVFVDCTDNFCIDVSQVEARITPRTKALLPVHLAGQMTDMPALMQIAKKHDLPVVEDSCQCILGEIDGKRAGTFGRSGSFSL